VTTTELADEVVSPPVEGRAIVADEALDGLHPPESAAAGLVLSQSCLTRVACRPELLMVRWAVMI
jgi:hypothetical protein